jgi:two-component system cell cycle sensor histidine kinase/response regulator CckA
LRRSEPEPQSARTRGPQDPSARAADAISHISPADAQFRAIFDNTLDAVLIADDSGTYVDANPAAATLLALSREELIGRHISDFATTEHRDHFAAAWAAFLRDGFQRGCISLRAADGTIREADYSAKANFLPGRHLSILRDITEERRRQAALRDSEERLDAVFRQVNLGIAQTDLTGRFRKVNQRYCDIVGRSMDEVLGLRMQEITHADDLPSNIALFDAMVADGSDYATEKRYVRGDGSEVWVNVSATLLRDQSGRPTSVIGVVQDITERKRTEDALRHREQQLRLALDAGRMGTWEWTVATGKVAWSASLERIHGRMPGTFPGTLEAVMEEIHHDDRDRVARAVAEALERKDDYRIEYRIVLPDGEIRWVEGRGKVFCGSDGSPQRIVGVCLDISERKRAQQALGESEQRFALFMNHLPGVAWIKDLNGRYIWTNDSEDRLWRRPLTDIPGKTDDDLFPAEIAEQFKRNDRLALASPRGIQIIETATADGAPTYSFVSKFPILDQERKPVLIGGVAIDITEQKQAEAKLTSEYAFRQAVERSMPAGVAAIDLEGRQTYVNRAFCNLLGWTEEELIGATAPFVYWPPGEMDAIRDAFASTLQGTAPPGGFELRFQRRSGDLIDVMVSISPLSSGQGATIGWVAAVSDITERKQFERAVQEAKETLQAVIQTSPLALIAVDLEGCVKFWNPAAERTFGWREDEVRDRFIPTIAPEDIEEFRALLAKYKQGDALGGVEVIRLTKDRGRVPFSVWTSPLRDASGEVTGALGIFADITERRLLEEQLRQSQKLESIGLLAGGIAHDFNNLLTGIMGNATLALDLLSPQEPARKMLADVVMASERAAHLTRQLLAYAGKGKFVIERVRLSELVREIATLLRSSVPKNVELRLDLDESVPVTDGDASQIHQLVMNLIINAAEAIGDQNHGTVSVATRSQVIDESRIRHIVPPGELKPGVYVTLEVEDTGCGMDESIVSRIFDPFFTTKFTGRGLGLAAAQGIVRGHKGAITLHSVPGKGTAFRVFFPASPAREEPVRQSVSPELSKSSGTILVVDDEEIVRRTAKSALERKGYSVLVAENGREAVEIVRSAPGAISAVLLDLTMPVMDGEETLTALRKMRPDLPVILSSGYNELEAVRRFDGKGLSGFVQKPYSASVLAEKIRSALA